jgi:HAD superfamily hydrolase (TIGR01549 family)
VVAYKGIGDILSMAKYKNIKISIVSSSPLSYVHRVILHFRWEFDIMVSYHDTALHKPHPEPFIEASHRLKIVEKDCWAVGDHPNDIIASKRAGMFSVGAA